VTATAAIKVSDSLQKGLDGGNPAQKPQAATKPLSDEDLMSLVQREDDAEAFALIYDRHATKAFSLARSICGVAAAEDVTQESFYSVWKSRGQFNSERASVRAWIFSTVRHRAIDWLRRESPKNRRSVGLAESIPLEAKERTEREAVRRDEGGRVRAVLGGLPSDQRQVIVLAYFGGMSQSEIARDLEVPIGTVKGRTRLGLEKLRRGVSNHSGNGTPNVRRPGADDASYSRDGRAG
jgi:RNA polymerase sigma-70 factor (ECF subfamily)